MFARLAATIDAVNRAAFHVGAALIAAIAIIYCYEVGARYFFDAPTQWANAMGGFFLSIGTFLAMPEVTRRGAHVAVDVLLNELSGRSRRRLKVALMLTAGLLCGTACAVTAIEVHRQFVQDINIMSTIIVPKWRVTVFIPIGFLGAAYYFLKAGFHPASRVSTD